MLRVIARCVAVLLLGVSSGGVHAGTCVATERARSVSEMAFVATLAPSRGDSSVASAESASAAPPDTGTAAGDTLELRFRVIDVLARSESGPGQVVRPNGVAVDAFGRHYVTDAALHRLQRFDERGRWIGETGSLGSGTGQMRRPGSVAMLGTLGVAVLDEENRRVLSYDLFGRLLGTLIDLADVTLSDELGRVDPLSLAADRGGAVYVVDAERDRILAFDFSGRYVRTIGGYGVRAGSFRGLSGLAVGRRGELVTAERVNARLQRLDPGGRVITTWPLAVRPERAAVALAVDDSSRIAVADESSGRLWLFDASGRVLATLTGLRSPRALAFARDGTLLVAEAGAGWVRRFAIDPRLDRSMPVKE